MRYISTKKVNIDISDEEIDIERQIRYISTNKTDNNKRFKRRCLFN